jgi:nucleotide-binding universal stress UspA family protein
MWNKIMCPIDFSEGSRVALREAVKLAKESGGELVLAHIWTPPIMLASEPVGLPASMLASLVVDAEKMLSDVAASARADGVAKVTPVFRSGAPWQEIVDIAKSDPSIELVVIGTHGRTGIRHALLGSVAEKVVRHSKCPVLVMHERPEN